MESSVSDDALAFVEKFEAAEQASQSARQRSERCRDYYDNKQLTDDEVAELQRRGQPPVVDNVIAGKVNWLVGQEMNRRTDPKAFPRTPEHEQGADSATDALRFVCDNTNWNKKRSAVWQDMLIEGYGGVEVVHVEKRGKIEVAVNRYPWDRLFFDPHSREEDFSDAQYLGAVIWSDRKAVEKQYPQAKDGIEGALSNRAAIAGTFEDRPQHQIWGDKERDRVRIVLMHYRDGDKWKWVKFTYGVVLESGESIYVNDDGESECPLIMQSAYVDRENNRYSETLKLLDMQDEINKRRSKLLHLASSRQTYGIKGAVGSVATMKREMARPDGHIEITTEAMEEASRVGMRPFDVIPTNDMAASQAALLSEAKDSIQNMGATEALRGEADGDSGRAVLAKQQGAQQSLTPLNDKLSDFTRRVYEAMWNRIRQFWTEERWIRVTDDERNVRFVTLNKRVTLADKLQEYPPEAVQQFAYKNGLGPNDPRLAQVVDVENPIETLEVDIILEEVPDMVTLEAETFEQLVNIDAARQGVLPLEMLIKASPLKASVKDEILEHLEQQQEQQGQDPRAEMEMASAQADIEETQTKAALNAANAQKSEVETQLMAAGY